MQHKAEFSEEYSGQSLGIQLNYHKSSLYDLFAILQVFKNHCFVCVVTKPSTQLLFFVRVSIYFQYTGERPWYSSNSPLKCFMKEGNLYDFGMAWGLINDRSFIFGWNISWKGRNEWKVKSLWKNQAYYGHIAPTVYVHLLAIKRSDCFLFFILSKSFVGFCLLNSSVETLHTSISRNRSINTPTISDVKNYPWNHNF